MNFRIPIKAENLLNISGVIMFSRGTLLHVVNK
jgi:hypothetical protein